jgi:purine nucleosidase
MRPRLVALLLLLALAPKRGNPTQASEPRPVIIDTDVAMGYPGHDVDDGLVLLLALNSPELDILGITASWGNHDQDHTYAKAREILAAAGRSDIPCLRGADGRRDLGRETPASRFICDAVKKRPGEVTLLVIGTTTNIATALLLDPEVAPARKEIVSMGGTLAAPRRWPFWAMIDLNYGADLPSARLVLESGVRFHMIHSRLCFQTIITPERYRRMTAEAPFMRDMLARQTRDW